MNRRTELIKAIGNDRRVKFCEEYVRLYNGSKAAIAAGYSEKGARVEAVRLLSFANIQNYIKYLRENIAEHLELPKEKVIIEFAKMAFSNIGDLHDGWLTLREYDELTDEQKACISEISSVKKRIYDDEKKEYAWVDYVKIKLHDKNKALENINKMLGYNEPDKHEFSGNVNINPRKFIGESD